MNLKNGTVFTSKFVGIGPSSYEKRIYRAAVWQRLRNTEIEGFGGETWERNHLKNLDIDGRMELKWIFKTIVRRAWTELVHLCRQTGFIKRGGFCWLDGDWFASQAVLHSMELVSMQGTEIVVSFMLLWPCIVSKAWGKKTNKMQQYRWFIVNCGCWLLTLSQHVSGNFMAIFRIKDHVLLHMECICW